MVRVASGTRDVDQAQPDAWQEESKFELLSSGSGDTKQGDEQAMRPEYVELGQEREAEKCGAFEEKCGQLFTTMVVNVSVCVFVCVLCHVYMCDGCV